MSRISYDELKNLFNYENGQLFWKINKYPRKKGFEAGWINKDGYKRIKINGKIYLTHRLVFLYHYGYMPENKIDHRDRIKSNNKIENLREISSSCNGKNAKISKNNTSGIVGVCWHKKSKRWQVNVRNNNGKNLYIGLFLLKLDAAIARYEAEQKYNYSCYTGKTTAKQYIDKISI